MSSVQSPNSAPSLLIVEDDNTARDIIVRMSCREFPDCTIHTAENGVIGVKLYQELAPDIVITDVKMPVMDGIEMAHQIRSINVEAKFIVVTAFSDKNSFEKFEEIGVCAYLLKPLDFKELFAAIGKCCADKRPQQE